MSDIKSGYVFTGSNAEWTNNSDTSIRLNKMLDGATVNINAGTNVTVTRDSNGITIASSSSGGGLPPDADYGDITVSGSGHTWTIDNGVITTNKIADGSITGSKIASGTIGTTQIADGAIIAAKITDGVINTAKFASGISPVTLTTSVPITYNGNVVFNQTDGKLYRWNGSGYTVAVPAVDITGQISNGQIADGTIAGTKFASSLAPVYVVSSVPSTNVGNMIFNTTDSTVYRWNGSSYTANVPATNLTGTLTTTQIGANTIQTGNIASNTITTGMIQAGAISASQIAASAITSDKLAANSVTAASISASSVTADKIATNAITSDKILANSIIAGKIAAGAISSTEIATRSLIASTLTITDITSLADNGDFEAGNLSWTLESGFSINNDSGNAHSGNYVLVGNLSSGAAAARNNMQTTVSPGDSYYVDGWIRTTGSAYGAVRIRGLSSSGAEVWTQFGNFVTSSTWTTSYGAGTVPSNVVKINAEAVIIGGSGTVYFDQVRMLRRANGNLIVDGAITASKLSVDNLSAVSANMGDVYGGVFRGGATSFSSGTGFWLGNDSGTYKFRVGDPAGAHIQWDGSTWTVVNWPYGAPPVAPEPNVYLSGQNIVVNLPSGAPSGYTVYTKFGTAFWGSQTSFPFSFDATGQHDTELQYYATATNYGQSGIMSASWNSLYV